MKKSYELAVSGLVGALALSIPKDAHALGPVDVEVGGKVGVGTNPTSSSINPLGFGLGARGGVAISGFYGGLNVMYYLGGSQDVPGGSLSAHALLYGVELGYGVTLLHLLTIRPQIGIGSSTFTASGSGLGVSASSSSSNLYLEPGVTGLVNLGLLYVGADANLLILPGMDNGIDATTGKASTTTNTAFTLHAQVGVKF